MSRYIADLETDGLLDDVTVIHCIVIQDIDTGVMFSHYGEDIDICLRMLADADEIWFHNGIRYDIPVIKKLHPEWTTKARIRDTMVMARLIYSNIGAWDGKLVKQKKLPGKLYGKHSLEAWGYRVGEWKGDYTEWCKAQGIENPWAVWRPEMQAYCEQDIRSTRKLYDRLMTHDYSQIAIDLEHDVQEVCAQMERNGFAFDRDAAVELYATLGKRRNDLHQQLLTAFAPWWVDQGKHTSPRTIKYWVQDDRGAEVVKRKNADKKWEMQRGWYEVHTEGCTYTKVKLTEFNPTSRAHIADRLITLYGWRPTDFTDGGDPTIDDDILNGLPYPECKPLAEYFMVDKRIAQVAEGKQAWLKLEKNGFIYGGINPNGAVTGRASHMHPNIAQVPKVKKPYGKECRSCFIAPKGWVLIGSDLSGLELRCLGHYMARYDDGSYARVTEDSDPHQRHRDAMLLGGFDLDRDTLMKTFGYAYLYGAQDPKLGSIIKPTASTKEQRVIGKRSRDVFQDNLTGLGDLKGDLDDVLSERDYLVGLDGREFHVRSKHSVLNTLLQSAGALIAKVWIVLTERDMRRRGYKHGWDGDYALCAWVHDEQQHAARTPEIAKVLGMVAREQARMAGEFLKLKVRIDAEFSPKLKGADGKAVVPHVYVPGYNWKDTH